MAIDTDLKLAQARVLDQKFDQQPVAAPDLAGPAGALCLGVAAHVREMFDALIAGRLKDPAAEGYALRNLLAATENVAAKILTACAGGPESEILAPSLRKLQRRAARFEEQWPLPNLQAIEEARARRRARLSGEGGSGDR